MKDTYCGTKHSISLRKAKCSARLYGRPADAIKVSKVIFESIRDNIEFLGVVFEMKPEYLFTRSQIMKVNATTMLNALKG